MMHTVLFFCRASLTLLGYYRLLFDPFIKSGEISICGWSEEGTDIYSAVPELYEILRGRESWRAVIFYAEDMSLAAAAAPGRPTRNPFDFRGKNRTSSPLEESDVPLIRLTHMIAGFPPLGVKGFKEAYTYLDSSTHAYVTVDRKDLKTEQRKALQEKHGNDLRLNYLEVSYTEEEIEKHRTIAAKYELLESQPAEVILVSTRKRSKENEGNAVRRSWENNLETESSDFWEKNNYPNLCKFLVYDIENPRNSAYRRELCEFWLGALTISLNKIPPSALQAYRLYRFELELSEAELADSLNNHIGMLLCNARNLEGYIKQSRETDDEPIVDQIKTEEIGVQFSSYDSGKFSLGPEAFPLVKSDSGSESVLLSSKTGELKSSMRGAIKGNRRVLDQASRSIRNKVERFLDREYELSEYQVAEVNEKLQSLEDEVLNPATKFMFNEEAVQKRVQDKSNAIGEELKTRVGGKALRTIFFIGLAIYLAGFLPYLVESSRYGAKTVLSCLALVAAALAVASSGGGISLLISKWKLNKKVREMNLAIMEEMNRIVGGSQSFSQYLTSILTYMKGKAVIRGVKLKQKTEKTRIKRLKAYQKSSAALVEHETELLKSFGLSFESRSFEGQDLMFDDSYAPRDNPFYWLRTSKERENAKFNHTGERIYAPYSFVTRLVIERENLFEAEETSAS